MIETGALVTLTDNQKKWYPSLFPAWGGPVLVVGPYRAGRPGEWVVRNGADDEMAVDARFLVA